ncbi:MAG TPA: EF-hand domain-containing protein [Burkholderiaceae bacterium]|nr:EF-hand domain-containing protein [Burkholderiaceae bacterium]
MKPIRLPHVLLAAVCALGAVAASAQSAPDAERAQKMQAELQKRFAAADANGDGRLTKEEAKGKMPMVYQHFDAIDSAHSGGVTLADIAAFARSQRGARKPAP